MPNTWATCFYLGLVAFQLALALALPGYQQEGLPVPSLDYKTLKYNCNALACWYTTLATSAVLHFTGIFPLYGIVDNFGPVMTVAILTGFGLSLLTYWIAILQGTQIRMSGNFIYDFWMGAVLNPRIGSVDLKMWQEVRIPWILLFYICVSGASRQYEDYGYVSPVCICRKRASKSYHSLVERRLYGSRHRALHQRVLQRRGVYPADLGYIPRERWLHVDLLEFRRRPFRTFSSLY